MSNRLHEIRKAKNITVGELARLSGCTRQCIHLLEKDPDRSPLLRTARSIARALGESVDYIWPDTEGSESA